MSEIPKTRNPSGRTPRCRDPSASPSQYPPRTPPPTMRSSRPLLSISARNSRAVFSYPFVLTSSLNSQCPFLYEIAPIRPSTHRTTRFRLPSPSTSPDASARISSSLSYERSNNPLRSLIYTTSRPRLSTSAASGTPSPSKSAHSNARAPCHVRKGLRDAERAVTVVSHYRAGVPPPEDQVQVTVHLDVRGPDASIRPICHAPVQTGLIRDIGMRSVLFLAEQANAAFPRRHQIQPEIVVPVDRKQTVGAQWHGGRRRDGSAGRIQPADGFLGCGQHHRRILQGEAEHLETGGFTECFRNKRKRRIRGRGIGLRTLHLQEPSQWLAHRL